MRQTKKSICIFMAPAVIIMVLVFLYPTLRTGVMSFFYIKDVTTPVAKWAFVGFDNFIKLFHTPLFMRSMVNMFKIWVYCGVATISLSLLFAVAFTSKIRAQKFFRAIVYLPNVIAAIAIAYMWLLYVFNNKFGLFTSLFSMLGLKGMASFQWLSSDHRFMSMCIASVFGNVGYFMMMYIAGIQKIPEDYYEAATIDGATSLQQFTRITLPLIKGVFATSAVLWTNHTMGFFALAQVFGGVNTFTPMLFTYQTLFGSDVSSESINAGMAAAAALLMTMIVVVAATIINRVIKDENYES